MRKILLFGLLVLILITLPLLTACEGTEPTSTPTPTAATTTPTAAANWWDEFGEPQYGGTIKARVDSLILDLDPYYNWGGQYQWYGDYLWGWDWTLERDIWPYKTSFNPDAYWEGCMVDTWELRDAQTLIVHLRHGVTWQDKPPVNGREFTAHDVEYGYDRIMGTGSFTEPCPLYAGRLGLWEKVTALDDYTVEFKFTYASAQALISVAEMAGQNWLPAREWVEQSDRENWETAVGTGAWILTEYTDGSSATYTKNPNYWGYDERYPENQLPYADELKVLCIPDMSTAVAAMRSGQIDILTGLGWQQAKALASSNPELQQLPMPAGGGGVHLRVDHEPFTDIRVRKALQMSIDRQAIAASHYGGSVDGEPCGVVTPAHKGYDYPYNEWSQELKDEYSYNPDRARELLAEAGFPDGFETNVVMPSVGDMELAEIMKAYFHDIGVEMEIVVMDMAALQAYARARKHDQMYWSGHACGRPMPPQMCIASTYTTDMANYGSVSDPSYDALYETFMNSSDPEEARQLVNDAVKYALEEHWVISVCPTVTYNVTQPDLKGYSGELFGVGGSGWLCARLWKAP